MDLHSTSGDAARQPFETEKSTYVKEAILGLGTLCFSFASGYFWRSIGVIGADDGVSGVFIYAEILSILLFACFFALYSLVHANKAGFWIVLAGSSAALFLSYPFQDVFFAGIAASAILFFLSSLFIRREARAQARLHWHSILRAGLRKFFTGLSIGFTIIFFAIISPRGKLQDAVIPKPVFNAFMPLLERPAQGLVPGFSLENTVDEALLNAIKEKAAADIDVSRLPKTQVLQFIAVQRAELNKQFGTRFTGEEIVSDALYVVIAKKLDEYVAPYKRYVPAAISIGYFVTLQFIFLLFIWMLYIVFPLITFALLKAGFLKQKSVIVEKEIISL